MQIDAYSKKIVINFIIINTFNPCDCTTVQVSMPGIISSGNAEENVSRWIKRNASLLGE